MFISALQSYTDHTLTSTEIKKRVIDYFKWEYEKTFKEEFDNFYTIPEIISFFKQTGDINPSNEFIINRTRTDYETALQTKVIDMATINKIKIGKLKKITLIDPYGEYFLSRMYNAIKIT